MKLSEKIRHKLFHGIVIPTAIEQGYTLADHEKLKRMMFAICNKYNSLSKPNREILISKAETHINQILGKESFNEANS